MFEKLKNALQSVVLKLSERELSLEEIDEIAENLKLELIESDVSYKTAEEIISQVKGSLVSQRISRREAKREHVEEALRAIVRKILDGAERVNLLEDVRRAKDTLKRPYVILFVGINGTGKTTTLAKVARYLMRNGFSVVLVCSDTHRAGAIEQLREHARRLGAKIIEQRYGADPAAVGRDGINYARAHRIDVVLIDTSGRMQTDRNLMDEMRKIIRVNPPDLRIFVGDALTGNDAVFQAKEFLRYTNFDAAILAKMDAGAKGGAVISIVGETGKPVIFLGTGPLYDDLKEFDTDEFLETLFAK